MDSENIKSIITTQNCWLKEGGLWSDPDLLRIKKSHLKYYPRPILPTECKKRAVITLRGPRRVGKTATLKLLIANLIEKEHWTPSSILWLTAETIRTMTKLEEIVTAILKDFTPRLFCIDEITSVTGWQRVIKKLSDTGFLDSCCLLLTGSSSHDLKKGAERMAGRRGNIENPDRVLLPMNFAQFCEQVRLITPDQNTADLQKSYLTCGGFPFRVEQLVESIISKKEFDPFGQMHVFDDVMFYEINRRRLDRNIALEVIGRISAIGLNASSYEGFSRPLTITKDTARKYLDALGDAFLLATISSYDTARNRVAPKKDRKFAWIDPALAFLPVKLGQGELINEDSRAEATIGVELLRRFEIRLWEGLSAPRNVFTWKSSSGKEVDFLVVNRARKLMLPVEVKYQNSINEWDFQVIDRAFGKGILVTKNISRKRAKTVAQSFADFFN